MPVAIYVGFGWMETREGGRRNMENWIEIGGVGCLVRRKSGRKRKFVEQKLQWNSLILIIPKIRGTSKFPLS